jgi:adhesin transport system outer membrane protein
LKSTLLGWVWLCMPLSAFAMPLNQVLALASIQHPTVRLKISEAKTAGFDLSTAKWARYPSFSSELSSDNSGSQRALLIQQPVWTGGRVAAQINAATANEMQASFAIREAQNAIMLQAAASYFEVLRWESRLATAQKNEAEHLRLLELIDRRVKAEISPLADRTLTAARYQQAISERIQFSRSLDEARISLEIAVGESVTSVEAPVSFRWNAIADAEAVELALGYSAERQKLLKQIEVSQAQIEISKSAWQPTVMVGVRRAAGAIPLGIDRDRAFVSLQFSPGPGLSAKSTVESALSRVENARSAVAVHDKQLEYRIKSSASELRALSAQLEPAKALSEATSEVVDSYLRQYQIARKNWLDVLNAQRERSQALYNLADTQANLVALNVRLMLLTGQLTPENLH